MDTSPINTPDETACPTDIQLKELLSGEIAENVRLEREHHVENCPLCQKRLDELERQTGGTFSFLRLKIEANFEPTEVLESIPDQSSMPDNSDSSLIIPAQIGYYHLERSLGKGGMGTVYQATHSLLKRKAAVKFIRRSRVSPESLNLFAQEIEAAGKLNSPHLVTTYDAGEVNGMPFLVMECLEGQTLKKFVQKNGVPPISLAINIIIQVAEGLKCAHDAGLVHRDVKPDNIWITDDNLVKVLDLGLMQIQENETTETGQPKVLAGSPDYMAPEQISQLGLVDQRTDIYSLGGVFYFLLTGHAPFADDKHTTVPEKLAAQAFEPFPALADFSSNASVKKLQPILDKMTAKEPSRRFQSMAELIHALEKPALPIFVPVIVGLIFIAAFVSTIFFWNPMRTKPESDHRKISTTQTDKTEGTNKVDKTEEKSNQEDPKKLEDKEKQEVKQENQDLSFKALQPGKKAGDLLVLKVNGIDYNFRWCPPGTFTMGAKVPHLDKQMTYEQLLKIAADYNMIDSKYTPEKLLKNNSSNNQERQQDNKDWLLAELQNWTESSKNSSPHLVTLTHGFWMLETEVSVEMWQNIMLPDYDNPKLQPQKNMLGETVPSRYIKLPIVGVNLQESQAFCQKLSRQINAPVSLPTEAQWEYACLAGTTDPLGVWQVPYYSNVWDAQLNAQQILQVGRYRRPDNLKPNAWGLDDMFGYVGEWCLDGYTEDLGTAPVTDPQTPSSGGKQVIRGVYPFPFENFEFTSSPPFKFRFQNFSFFRNAENPENREPEGGYVGVRICINVPAEPEKDKK